MQKRPRLSIDDKIAKAQERVDKLTDKLNAAKKELKDLLDKKETEKKAELLDVLNRSEKSYDEILAFLKGNEGE